MKIRNFLQWRMDKTGYSVSQLNDDSGDREQWLAPIPRTLTTSTHGLLTLLVSRSVKGSRKHA